MKRVFTPAHKLELHKALKGKRKSEETREKIRVVMTGRKLSEKTKLRMKLRENRKQRIHQKIMEHYLKVHEISPKLDRRKIQTQCHICRKEIEGPNYAKGRPPELRLSTDSAQILSSSCLFTDG